MGLIGNSSSFEYLEFMITIRGYEVTYWENVL
jgi:hypothetical protein